MTQEQQQKKKSRVWIHVLWISVTIAAILIAAVCIPAFMVFDSKPMMLDRPSFDPRVSLRVMQKGQRNMEEIRRSNPMTVSRIRYTNEEFNFIISSMVLYNSFSGGPVPGIRPNTTSLTLKDGVFRIKHIMKTEHNPFGKYLNLQAEIEVSVKDGVESFRVISAKAGTLNIPNSRAEKEISSLLDQYYRGTAQEDMIRNSVRDLHADKDGVYLEYKPYTLMNDIDKIYFGGSGDFLRQMGHESARQ